MTQFRKISQLFSKKIDGDLNSHVVSKFYANRLMKKWHFGGVVKNVRFSGPFWPLLTEGTQSFQGIVPPEPPVTV